MAFDKPIATRVVEGAYNVFKTEVPSEFLKGVAGKMWSVVRSYYHGDASLAEQLPHYFYHCAAVALPTRDNSNKGLL